MAHKKPKKFSKEPTERDPGERSMHVRLQAIKNGYLKHSTTIGPEVMGGYKTETTYHRKNPALHKRISGLMKAWKGNC